MSAETNKAVVQRVIEYFNSKEHKAKYLDLYDANCVLHGYPLGLAPGHAGVEQFYAGLWSAFPDGHLDVEDMVAEDDRVACRYTLRGTHTGGFMGVPATDRPVTVRGMTVLRFVDGKCVERWQSLDELGMLQQLGAIPMPGQGGL